MDDLPRLHLDTTMVFAPESPMREPGGLEPFCAAIEAHPDRLLYGTDFPNTPYAYASESLGIEALGLRPETLAAVMHGNAARLLANATR